MCREVRANQQEVMVRVRGRHHLRRGRAERAGSVHLLTTGVLVGGPVGSNPEALGRAGGATIDVASEDDGAGGRAAGEERLELGALRGVRGHLIGLMRGQVGGAHVDADSGADA